MFSIFSFSDNAGMPAQALDLQLLSDDELLSVWEQTQFAELVLADKGIPPKNVNNYAKLVEAEIQQRAMLDSKALMQNAMQNREPFKNFTHSEELDFFD